MRGLYLRFLQAIICLTIFFFSSTSIYAQDTYLMSNTPTTVTDPIGILYDDGGNGFPGFYSVQSGTDPQVFTICPDNAGCVVLDFEVFITEGGSNVPGAGDFLNIYDGPNTSAPLIGSYSGSLISSDNAFGQVFAGNGCVTLLFNENGGFGTVGFALEWTSFSSTCITNSTLDPPVDCETAILVCDDETLNYNSNGPGNQELIAQGINGCLTQGEHQSAWFLININPAATVLGVPLEFTIAPDIGGQDYDFAVYGPVEGCDNLGDLGGPIRCSYADDNVTPNKLTGLRIGEVDVSESPSLGDDGSTANGFVAPILVNPGESYYIVVDNFSVNEVGFDMYWGDDVENNNLLDCSVCDFALIMPDDFSVCQGETFTINPTIFKGSGLFNYNWTSDPPIPFTGGSFITVEPPLGFSGEVVFSLVVSDNEVNNCVREGEITIDIQSDFLFGGTEITSVLCPDEATDVELFGTFSDDTNFTWNIGNATFEGGDSTSTGPFQVSWEEPGDKIITVALQQGDCNDIIVEFETEVFPIIETPTVMCPTIPSDSTFTWTQITGAINYTVTVLINGTEVETFNTTSSEYIVEGAQGEDVEIIVLANHGTGYCDGVSGSVECTILGCEIPADFGILAINDTYCVENAPVTLIGTPPGGTFTIGEDEVTSFDPSQGDGEYIIQYTFEDEILGCLYFDTDTVTVLAALTGDFTVTDSICTNGFATVEYTGNAGEDANYSWTFNGGTPATSTSSGPIDVSWDTPGTKSVVLTIDANGCSVEPPFQFINVIQAPTAPELTCDEAGLGCASVSWTTEAGHLYYIETFLNGNPLLPLSLSTNGNFNNCTFDDGDTLLVNVYAEIDGEDFCGQTEPVSIECIVNTCDETPLSILGIDETYCLGDQIIEITTDPIGGTLSTTSLGLVDSTFTIADAGVGDHTILYEWTDEDGCFNDTTFTTTIYDIPTASFTINPNPVCEGSGATITYDGTADVEDFEWNFGEDVVTVGLTGEGPHNVIWSTTGIKTITLIVTANGCPSEMFSADLEIIPEPQTPTISCGPSTEDCVTFEWTTSDGDNGYTFSLLITPPTGSPMTQTGLSSNTNSYTVCDLEPGTEVRINGLRAVAFEPCTTAAPAEAFTCTAIDCSEILTISGLPDDVCADGTIINFNFVAPVGAVISGNGVTQNGNNSASFNPATAGTGVHTISLDYTDPDTNCPPYNETTQIEVFEVPTASFDIAGNTTEFCIGEPVTFTFNGSAGVDSYDWNFGAGASTSSSTSVNPPAITYSSAGTKTITLAVNDNGCLDETSQTITIVAPLATPDVTCGTTNQTSVTFEWDNIAGSTGYSISYTIDSGAPVSDNLVAGTISYTVSPLTPGQSVEITVIALGTDPCGDSEADIQVCVAQDCPTINPEITGLDAEYCDDCGSPITLTATPIGGTFTLDTNPAAITTFDPCGLSGTFTINYTYTDGECDFSTSEQVTVNTRPTADIAVSATEICLDGNIDISFSGTAGTTANYNWDFGADANPQTANTAGPHNVSWASSGVKTITLNLDENGCTATAATTTIEVFDPLPAPTISCGGSTENSVSFNWNDVGGTGEFIYDVYLNGTLDLGAQSTFATTYDRNGLVPGDEVRIVLYAIGAAPCGDSPTAEQTCFAENCPTITPTIDNLDAAYCQDSGAIPLTATNTGGDGTGTGEFTLNSVVITEFDTNQAPGTYTINYTYTQGSCSGSTSAQVTIDEQPQADIAALLDACISELVEVSYNGTAPAGANFTWDFGTGAIPATQTGEGPWQVTWDSEGTKTISVTVELNGCQDDASITMEVIAPLETPIVACTEVTQNDITFEWNNVAATYNVSVIINTIPTFDDPAFIGETYTATGLAPGDEVSIVVEPLGDAPCGNGIAGATSCIASDCPELALEIIMDNTSFCLDEEGTLLSANPTGGSFTINDDPTPVGDFNPALMGAGSHTVYYNYTNPDTGCPYVDSLEVNVFELPEANFDLGLQACPGEPITLTFTGLAPNTSDSGFAWGDFNGAEILSGTGAGPYELSWTGSGTQTVNLDITTDNGCTSSFEQTIEITDISLLMPETLNIAQGDSVLIAALANSSTSDISTYTWDNGEFLSCDDCASPTANPRETTTYTLNVADEDGCSTAASVLVNVIIPEPVPELIIANAFSPNGDGVNDIFRPMLDELAVGMEMQIYNRWGEMLYETTDPASFWDGTYKDETVPMGVYVYWVKVEFSNGFTQLLTGNVTVFH